MRLDTFVNLALFASLTTATTQQERHSNFQRHISRSRRLVQDIGVAVSSLLSPRQAPPRSPSTQRKIVKRGGINSAGQCVLRTVRGPFESHSTDDGESGGPSSTTGRNATSTGRSSSRSSSTSTSRTSTKTAGGGGPGPTETPESSSSAYKKVLDSSGSEFFDDWNFWSGGDPTHGTVQYTTKDQAEAANLIEVNDSGHAILRVETTPQITNGWRKSVRIETPQVYSGGVWVLDVVHMPTGCGTWPAWWTHGPDWPAGGEIDILEGVHDAAFNQAALHTASGCTLASNFAASGTNLNGLNCAALETGNTGCGIKANEPNSYGAGLNAAGGGIYAMVWDDSGVAVYFFARGKVPRDLTSEQPKPETWGFPAAMFPASTCAPYQFNRDHKTIINTTLCGDWAGGAWAAPQNDGSPSCAQKTGVATCAEYVQNNGAAFAEAYWQIKNMKVYQRK